MPVSRTVPCSACRSKHVVCTWPSGISEACIRCTDEDTHCSGPERKSRRPCTSCLRAKTRCEWPTRGEMCLRCLDRGGLVCPLPPKLRPGSADKVSPSHQSPSSGIIRRAQTGSSLLRSNPDFNIELVFTKLAADAVKRWGSMCHSGNGNVHDLQVDLTRRDKLLRELGNTTAILTALRFTVYLTNESAAPVSDVTTLEDLSVNQWSRSSRPSVSFQLHTLRQLSKTHWNGLQQASVLGLPNVEQILEFVSILRISSNFRLLPRSSPSLADRSRHMLAYGVLQSVSGICRTENDRPEVAEKLKSIAFDLILSEARLSLALGRCSLIKESTWHFVSPTKSGSMTDHNVSPKGSTCTAPSFLPLSCWPKVLPDIMTSLYALMRFMATMSDTVAYTRTLHRSVQSSLLHLSGEIDRALSTDTSSISASSTEPSDHRRRALICVDLFTIHLLLVSSQWAITREKQSWPQDNAELQFEEQITVTLAMERLAARLLEVLNPEASLFLLFDILNMATDISVTIATMPPVVFGSASEGHRVPILFGLSVAATWNQTAEETLAMLTRG